MRRYPVLVKLLIGIPTMTEPPAYKLKKTDYQTVYQIISDSCQYVKSDVNAVLKEIEEKLNVSLTPNLLRKYLPKLGFRLCKDLLVETHESRARRIKYLRDLQQWRAENRNIVYLYSTVMTINVPTIKEGVLKHEPTKGMVAHAAGRSGFIEGSLIIIKMPPETSAILQKKVMTECCENWMVKQLIPNLPLDSVIVADDKIYSRIVGKIPSFYSSKISMLKWLMKHGIQVDPNLLKPEVYNIVQQHREQYFKFEYCVDVHKLPPYHPKLNPMVSIWEQISAEVNETLKAHRNFALVSLFSKAVNKFRKHPWESVYIESEEHADMLLKREKIFDTSLENNFSETAPTDSDISISSGDE